MRFCIWPSIRREKKPERKRKSLIRPGDDPGHACQWNRTRMGGWAVAQSPIPGTTITLERLRKRGYLALRTYYVKVAPSRTIGKPLSTACPDLFSGRPVQWPLLHFITADRCERLSPSVLTGGAGCLITQRY